MLLDPTSKYLHLIRLGWIDKTWREATNIGDGISEGNWYGDVGPFPRLRGNYKMKMRVAGKARIAAKAKGVAGHYLILYFHHSTLECEMHILRECIIPVVYNDEVIRKFAIFARLFYMNDGPCSGGCYHSTYWHRKVDGKLIRKPLPMKRATAMAQVDLNDVLTGYGNT